MKQRKYFWLLALSAFLIGGFTSCDDDDDNDKPEPPIEETEKKQGAYILNNGLWNGNNATVSFYNIEAKTVVADQYMTVNNKALGDSGQDIVVHGSKAYIAVYGSYTLEVVDKNTLANIKTITSTDDDGQPQAPRTLIAKEGYVYMTLYDGYIARIDTVSLSIDLKVATGNNPEYMAIANGKLYVANSGGINYPNYDNTVSVFDIAQLNNRQDIEVLINPGLVCSDSQGDVYVISIGNYDDVPNTLQRITAGQYSQSEVLIDDDDAVINATIMTIHDDIIYAVCNQHGTTEINYIKYDTKNEKVITKSFITDEAKPENPSSIDIDPLTGNIYIGDAIDYISNGDMYVYDANGKLVDMFEVGISPKKTTFFTE